MPNTPSPLDLKNVRKTIDEIDEQIVKYIAYIKYATEATVDNKYYDTKPGDEVMEQKI
ncbi:MAG: hypothetical protein H6767_01980 [Candidatus Peribacteria bacterium]|nr:MAG: hypothetical protein H6767_01980 [Candidatus Peribacteria bacterium]